MIRRKLLRILLAIGFAVIGVTRAYCLVAEETSGQDHAVSPPPSAVLVSAEAPGGVEEMTEGATLVPVSEEGVGEEESHPPESQNADGQNESEAETGETEEAVYLGEFELTGYCSCDVCCGKKEIKLTKMETVPKPGYTVAADPEVIALGSSVVIDGVTYRVEDVGQAIKGNSIDIFFATHEEAIEFGRQKMSVYLK